MFEIGLGFIVKVEKRLVLMPVKFPHSYIT